MGGAAGCLADTSCHGKRLHSFQAPAAVGSGHGGHLAESHKRPRFGVNDCINVDSVACRLRSVSPGYAKDAHQFAFYEAEEL